MNEKRNCVCLTGKTELIGKKDCFVTNTKETVRTSTVASTLAVDHVHFSNGYPQKKGVDPYCCYLSQEMKHVNNVSCVGQLSSVKNVTNVPTVVPDLPVGVRLHQFWRKWAAQSFNSPQRRLHSPLPVLAKLVQVPNQNKLLCKSPQEHLPVGGIASAGKQKCNRVGQKPRFLGLYSRIFLTTTVTYTVPQHSKQIFEDRVIQHGDPRGNKATSLQAEEWVTSIGFKDTYFHLLIHSPGSTGVFISRVSSTSSTHYHLVSQQHSWSLLCPPPWGVDILFLLFSPSDVRRPMSDVRRPASDVRRHAWFPLI